MNMTTNSIAKCSSETQTACTSNSINPNRTFINNRLTHSEAIHIKTLMANSTMTFRGWTRCKCNPSPKDHSSLIHNKLINNTTKKWTLLSKGKNWSWPKWRRSELYDSSSLLREELTTSDWQICLNNSIEWWIRSRACRKAWFCRPIRLKINTVQKGIWEATRTLSLILLNTSNIITSCHLSNPN